MKKFHEYGRSLLIGIIIGVVAASIFVAGFFVRDLIDYPGNVFVQSNDYELLLEVDSLLERYYLRELPPQTTRQYAAIRGMLNSLNDRNTFFIDPPVAQSESDALAGAYGGIGVHLTRNEWGEFVLFPFENSPALNAGIADGDILVSINGDVVSVDSPQDTIDQMMRGEVGSGNGVELTVKHNSGDSLTTFIEFDIINVPSVVWRVLNDYPDIGYVQIIRFTNRTPFEFEQAIAELTNTEIKGLILDLRNNGGGLLEESIQIANQFISGGIVSYEITTTGENVIEVADEGIALDLPLVVLVNGGTASASELLAGAIADRERGVLVGQQTFGKGTIQQIFSLSDDSSIHVTSAEWLTPNRNIIDGKGLTPTITMIPDENGRDVEIGEAIRYLQARILE